MKDKTEELDQAFVKDERKKLKKAKQVKAKKI